MSSIAEWRAAGLPTLTAWVLYLLGQVQRAQGDLDASARTCRQALEMTAVPGRPPPPAAGPAHVGLGEVAYQRDELDTALRRITEGITLCRQFAYIPPLAAGLVTLAWIRQASGDPGGALAAIAEAKQASPGPAGLLNPVPAQRARLLLAQGDLAGAARWTAERGLDEDDEPDYAREPGHLVLARVLLAQDRPGPALALLDRLHAAAAAPGPGRQPDRDRRAAGAGRWPPAARRPRRWTRWPRRSRWPARRAMSGSSPTRDRRWPRCWPG